MAGLLLGSAEIVLAHCLLRAWSLQRTRVKVAVQERLTTAASFAAAEAAREGAKPVLRVFFLAERQAGPWRASGMAPNNERSGISS